MDWHAKVVGRKFRMFCGIGRKLTACEEIPAPGLHPIYPPRPSASRSETRGAFEQPSIKSVCIASLM